MIASLLDEILAGQAGSGAFVSHVDDADGSRREDHNCCATALVALELLACRQRLDPSGIDEALVRALAFIETCSNDGGATFAFYPPGAIDARLPVRLDADWDDTALAWLALLDAGRRSRAEVDRALDGQLASDRLIARPDRAPTWVRRGAMPTWLGRPASLNTIDAVVNANVVALSATVPSPAGALADVGERAGAMLDRLVAADIVERGAMRWIAPYYAHPLELLYALSRAVQRGARHLADALRSLQRQPWAGDDLRLSWPRDRPLFCNAHGRPYWRSAPVQAARELSWRLGCGPVALA